MTFATKKTAGPLRISAIVPSYNQAGFIRETLDSILSQGYPHLEVIVVDGLSTDGTQDVLAGYGDRIQWISEKDAGQSDALNKGLRKATGDIIAWLNSDDTYEPGAFLTVAQYFSDHTDCQWLFGKCRIMDVSGKEIRKWVTAYKNFFLRRYSYDRLLIQNTISQMATFFRKSAAVEAGYINAGHDFAMDYDLWLRLGRKYKPAFIDRYLGRFRLHPSSKSTLSSHRIFSDDYAVAQKYGSGKKHLLFLHTLFHVAISLLYPVLHILDSIGKRFHQR